MANYQEMTFHVPDYKERMRGCEDYEIEAKLFSDMQDFIRILLDNERQIKIWFDGMTYVIEYNYQDEELSGVSLEWVGDGEIGDFDFDTPGRPADDRNEDNA